MFWHVLAYQNYFGKFTKVLGIEKTPSPLGNIPIKSRIFLYVAP